MHTAHALDISKYDVDFLERTLQKHQTRIACANSKDYFTYLESSNTEVQALKSDLLVNYSEFFRSPLSCAMLERVVLPGLAEQKKVEVPQTQKRKKKTRQATILLVENDADNMRAMRALLGGCYTIIEAAHCNEALAAAERGGIDFVLTDVSMPDGECAHILEAARNSPALKGVPIVAVTAHAMQGDRERILALGFDGYIAKPVDADVLDKTLQELMHAI